MVEPQELSSKRLTLKNFQTFKMLVDSSFDFSEGLIQGGQDDQHDIVYSEIKTLALRLKAIIGDQYYQELMVPKNQEESKTPQPKQQDGMQNELEKTHQMIQKSETLNEVKYWVNELGIQMNDAFGMNFKVTASMKLDDYLKDLKLQEERMLVDDGEWSFQKKQITIDHPRASFKDGKIKCEYEGEMKNNIPEGYGQLSYVYKNDASSKYTFTYNGYFKNGLIYGTGYMINGEKFSEVGNYQLGKSQGQVKDYYSNGKLYCIGSSVDGRWNSYCKFYYKDGSILYVGYLTQNLCQGRGKFYYIDGRTFEGIWKKGLKVSGIMTTKNKKTYIQTFDDEKDINDQIDHYDQKPINEEEI